METKKYITYLLLFVLIGVVLVIINELYNDRKNDKNKKYILENFSTTTTTSTGDTSILYSSGSQEVWTVPNGVTKATFTVIGGSGGGTGFSNAGYGANVTATLTVIPNTTYNIYVGKNGDRAISNSGGIGGFNEGLQNSYRGGNGGTKNSTATSDSQSGGGGGGAASYITLSTPTTPTTPTLIIVAGGGGGAGGDPSIADMNGIDSCNSVSMLLRNIPPNFTEESTNGKSNNINNSIGGGAGGGIVGGTISTKLGGGGGGAGSSYVIQDNNNSISATCKPDEYMSAGIRGMPLIKITYKPSPPPTTANALTSLIPVLKNSTDNLNTLRFSWIDNQQRLDDITKRINKVKDSLGGLKSQTPMYSASGKMTFY